MRRLSPIEMLVDQATGFKAAPRVGVTMRCPCCEKSRASYRHWTDPEGTAIVEALCQECGGAEDTLEIKYFDEAGKGITA